jgi:hypothetical protein
MRERMRGIKKLIIWALIPVSLELCAFTYVDKFYLSQDNNVKIVKVENKKAEAPKLKNVDISEKAKDIKVSYDGRYVCYEEDGNLKLLDFNTGEVTNIEKDKNNSISYHTWLPDRNRLYIAEKVAFSKGRALIKMYSYDVDKKEKYEWVDNHQNKTEIELQSKQSEVKEIAMSTLSGLAYIKVDNTNNNYSMYRVNVMTQLEKMRLKNTVIGKIGVTPTDDRFIYEDKKQNKLNIEGYSSTKKPLNNLLYLGVDYDNLIYLGVKQEEKVSEVLYGSLNEPMEKWNKIKLDKVTAREQIHVTLNGQVYLDKLENHELTDLKSSKKCSYEGKLTAICENSIVYFNNGKLYKVPIK